MKKFMSASQIARLEEVTPTTVQRWVRKGVFPGARKVGRQFRIPLDDYHRWREATKIEFEENNNKTDRTSVRTDVRV